MQACFYFSLWVAILFCASPFLATVCQVISAHLEVEGSIFMEVLLFNLNDSKAAGPLDLDTYIDHFIK